MRLDFSHERVLAIVAHPDDAELLCAGTLARAAVDGAAIALCVLCNGDKGQPDPPIENLGDVRRGEMEAAARLLRAELQWNGAGDGELADTPPQRRRVVEWVRQFRPSLILAHAPNDYHADHRAASALAEAASWFCTSRGHLTDSPPLSLQPALWWMDTVNTAEFEPGFFVDITDYVDLKSRMLQCHKSQLARAADISPLREQMVFQCRTRGHQAGVAAAEAFRLHKAWRRVRAW